MTAKKLQRTESAELRRRAEERLGQKSDTANPPGTCEDPLRLPHELQVHQVELEMQNAELRQARDEVETVLGKYTDLYDFGPVGYFTLDRNGLIRSVNLTGAGLLRVERSRLIGRRFVHFVADTDYPAFAAFLENVFTAPAKVACDVELLNEGSYPLFVQVEAVAAVSGQECCIAVLDITERKLAKEALKESENKFRRLAEQALVGIFLQQDGFFEYVNPKFAEIFGYTVEECIGRLSFKKLVYPDDISQVEDEVQQRLSGQNPMGHYHFRGVTKKNEIVYIELYGTTTYYNNKTASIGTLLDITERKRAEEERLKLADQFRQAQKMEAIGTLAGGIAHDFNNILTTIVANASLMQMRMEENSPFQRRVEQILAAVERASNLTKSLLTYSSKQISKPVPVELNGIVKGIDNLLRRLVPENIEFNSYPSAEDLIIKADFGHIEQVLMNLVTNARDAMPEGGNLTLHIGVIEIDDAFLNTHSYGKPCRHAILSVADNGAGMSEITRERIFEPFFTTKEPGKGTGLGLAMVYGIVKQHDGFIDVRSEPGHGTTFNIYLPLVDSIVQQPCLKDKRPPVGGTETILLLEDDKMVRQLIKDVLNCNGYNVIEAVDGEDGVGKFKKHRDEIHLILTDVMMPKKNGKEAYDEIRQIKGDIKAIFMSGYSATTTKKILEEGLDYLAKPVTPRVLLAKIREVLNT